MIRAAFALLAVAGLLAAGCGSDDAMGGDAGGGADGAAMKKEKAEAAAMKREKAEAAAMKKEKAGEDPAMKEDAAMKAKAAGGRGTVVKVGNDPQFGRIITDRRGQALYIFDKEKSRRSECYGECATAWPPLLTRGKPRAIRGARRSLLGTTRRKGGKRQVTYRGQPLYYYVDDAPRRTLCHNVAEFGGLWLVIRSNGKRVS